MTIVSARLALDPRKVRRAKAALGTRTTRETINKALDLAIAWEEARGARPPVLSPQKQRRLDLLLDYANAGRLTSSQQSRELEQIVHEAQLLTIRKARLLAGILAP
jgi:hypothetical protein